MFQRILTSMEALCNCSSVNQVASTDFARDVTIKCFQFDSPLHCHGWKNNVHIINSYVELWIWSTYNIYNVTYLYQVGKNHLNAEEAIPVNRQILHTGCFYKCFISKSSLFFCHSNDLTLHEPWPCYLANGYTIWFALLSMLYCHKPMSQSCDS